VYSAFRRAVNVGEVEMDPRLQVFLTLDFNVDPLCSLVVQKWQGEIRVLDEIVLHRTTTEQTCEEFERKFGRPRGGVVVCGDANGTSRHTAGDSTDYDVIRNFFKVRNVPVSFEVPSANPKVRDRVALVNGKLCNSHGDVSLIVSPLCKELIDDFEQVAYEEESTQIDKNKDRRRTHASDALGYMVWQECRAVSTIGERNQRLS
jgi:hypothetical protein